MLSAYLTIVIVYVSSPVADTESERFQRNEMLATNNFKTFHSIDLLTGTGF